MSITTLPSREFNQNPSTARKASIDGPVFITDRGEPVQVILDINDYRKLTKTEKTIADIFSPTKELAELDFEPEKIVWDNRSLDL
ncbi:type II toxin-antitoxin system Phd/YefM family antitoxin [bacterium AH-315-K03]|nr:type II toxin-antitoxin system Phd/YefM family antitoxin [bacterium AH-315-K03]